MRIVELKKPFFLFLGPSLATYRRLVAGFALLLLNTVFRDLCLASAKVRAKVLLVAHPLAIGLLVELAGGWEGRNNFPFSGGFGGHFLANIFRIHQLL